MEKSKLESAKFTRKNHYKKHKRLLRIYNRIKLEKPVLIIESSKVFIIAITALEDMLKHEMNQHAKAYNKATMVLKQENTKLNDLGDNYGVVE